MTKQQWVNSAVVSAFVEILLKQTIKSSAVLTDSKDPNAYWRWLKRKLLKENNQTVSDAHAFKFLTLDGKRRFMDAIDSDGVIKLAAEIPSKKSIKIVKKPHYRGFFA